MLYNGFSRTYVAEITRCIPEDMDSSASAIPNPALFFAYKSETVPRWAEKLTKL